MVGYDDFQGVDEQLIEDGLQYLENAAHRAHTEPATSPSSHSGKTLGDKRKRGDY